MTGPPAPFYRFADEDFDRHAGGDIGMDVLIACEPLVLTKAEWAGFEERFTLLREFQRITLELFRASLAGEAPGWIAEALLGDAPAGLGAAYHRSLPDPAFHRPHFFRTDELCPGVLSEVQCPGSGWANHELLQRTYQAFPEEFGISPTQPALSEQLAHAVRGLVGDDPRIFYLLDNASQPHGARYFVARTRAQGLRYYAWDAGLHPRECNLVRAHDWISPVTSNFHQQHLAACAAGSLRYDLPPIAVFDSKVIYALPFEAETRAAYPDAVRAMLPRTQLIGSGPVRTMDGEPVSDTDFAETAAIRRRFYLKYAGTDVNLNWGSRAVYSLKNSTRGQASALLASARADHARGRPWLLQEARRESDSIRYFDRRGREQQGPAYRKLSAFYGPGGLMGVLAYHLHAPKIHGSSRTVLSAAL